MVLKDRAEEAGAAHRELEKLSERLFLPATVTDEAVRICESGLQSYLSKSRPINQITASSLYAACREKDVPATLDDLAVVTGITKDDIARCYRLLVRGLDLKIPVADPAEYVTRVSSRARVGPKVEADALEILSKAQKAGITGGVYATGLAASAVYLASIRKGERLTEREAADAAGVAESTVRKENKRLRKVLGAQLAQSKRSRNGWLGPQAGT